MRRIGAGSLHANDSVKEATVFRLGLLSNVKFVADSTSCIELQQFLVSWRHNNLCNAATDMPFNQNSGRPHENARLRKRTRIASFWPIVHMDPENAAPENALF